MVLLKKGTITAAFVVASVFTGQVAFAQDAETTTTPTTAEPSTEVQFSNDELRQFIKANTAAVELQKEGRQAVVNTIEEAGLSVDRFNELAKANRQKKLEEVAAGKEEIAAFSDAVRKVVKLQPEMKKNVEEAITSEGLSLEKYEAILAAFQEDVAVQTKVKLLLQTEE